MAKGALTRRKSASSTSVTAPEDMVDSVSLLPPPSQYGRSDSYRVATTQDKDDKDSPKKKNKGKDLDDLKKEVPLVSAPGPLAPSHLSRTALTWGHVHAHARI